MDLDEIRSTEQEGLSNDTLTLKPSLVTNRHKRNRRHVITSHYISTCPVLKDIKSVWNTFSLRLGPCVF